MLFAAYYFGSKHKESKIIIPVIATIVFLAHPVGLQSWFIALYWMIPLGICLLPKKYPQNIVLKSFGATFTAHAVGSAIWAWSVPMTVESWMVVFQVVPYERTLFALGIAASYLVMNTVLEYVTQHVKVPDYILHIEKQLSLKPMLKHFR